MEEQEDQQDHQQEDQQDLQQDHQRDLHFDYWAELKANWSKQDFIELDVQARDLTIATISTVNLVPIAFSTMVKVAVAIIATATTSIVD